MMRISSIAGRTRPLLVVLIVSTLIAGLAFVGVRSGDDAATHDAATGRPASPQVTPDADDPVPPPPEVMGLRRARPDDRPAKQDHDQELGGLPFDGPFPAPKLLDFDPVDFIAARHTLSHPSFRDIVTVPFDVAMPHDGIELYVEVTKPDPALHGDGPWPVIMEISPYHGTIASRIGDRIFPDPRDANRRPLGLTGYFAPRGYAVVMVDLRGTGRSQGCLDHLGPNDAKDVAAIVEWAAAQPWSNGRVGLTGHSYVGSTPSLAAAMKPKGLVTIVPSAGLASMYDHQFQYGVPYAFQWLGPIYAYEELAIKRHLPSFISADSGDNFGNDVQYVGCGLPNSAATAGHGQINGQYQAWHADRDWREDAAAADIPIFMVHGVNDNAARIPAAEWFFGMREPRAGDKVWIGQWDHGVDVHPNRRFEQWQYALHAWFDKHLKRMDVDTGPPVEAFLNGERVATDEIWGAADASVGLWPEGVGLRTSEPDGLGSAFFLSLGGASGIRFLSEPMTTDMVMLGLPRMQLNLSLTTTQSLHIIAGIYARGEDGDRVIGYCAIEPLLRDGVDRTTPVVPGREMELHPQCFTVAHHVRRGERLYLDIATTSPHHIPVFAVEGLATVFTGPGKTSIDIPLVRPERLYRDVPLRLAS